MNGPENYAEAERLIDYALTLDSSEAGAMEAARGVVALAQVHATLALVALRRPNTDAWRAVCPDPDPAPRPWPSAAELLDGSVS